MVIAFIAPHERISITAQSIVAVLNDLVSPIRIGT